MNVFSGFLYFWGIIFLIATLIVAVLKKEKLEKLPKDQDWRVNVRDAYHLLLKIMKLPNMKMMIVILLTIKV